MCFIPMLVYLISISKRIPRCHGDIAMMKKKELISYYKFMKHKPYPTFIGELFVVCSKIFRKYDKFVIEFQKWVSEATSDNLKILQPCKFSKCYLYSPPILSVLARWCLPCSTLAAGRFNWAPCPPFMQLHQLLVISSAKQASAVCWLGKTENYIIPIPKTPELDFLLHEVP